MITESIRAEKHDCFRLQQSCFLFFVVEISVKLCGVGMLKNLFKDFVFVCLFHKGFQICISLAR